ncbi:MAG: hypothetical protein ACM3ZA_11120 [Bacillota bacterium]
MAQLFVPLHGGFGPLAGSGRNQQGEDLEWPAWRGAEIGLHSSYADVLGAVPEAEARDWNIGVRHPLYRGFLPERPALLDAAAEGRKAALVQAEAAADSAHQVGARYLVFAFPWPALLEPGAAYPGWDLPPDCGTLTNWTVDSLYQAGRDAFTFLAALQDRAHIRIALEVAGPNRLFYENDLFSRLFREFPSLSLCLDTARLRLLAETHGLDGLEMARRWLPWTRYLRLHSGRRLPDSGFQDHLPTLPDDPEAHLAREVVAVQDRATVVLDHDPRLVSPQHLEESRRFAAALVGLAEKGEA